MYGANFLRFAYDEIPLGYVIGTNSEVFKKVEIVAMASGFGTINTGALDVLGIVDADMTMSADNQTVAKKEVPFYAARADMTFEMDFDGTETVAYQGYLYTLSGAVGAQVVAAATRSATVGIVELVKLDPRREGSTVRGLFRFARPNMGWTVAS
jgi:hypothetical protein